jgi:hypothetical protein
MTTTAVNLRLTAEERTRIQAQADRAGLNLSAYMRQCAGPDPAERLSCASGGRYTSATVRAILDAAEALADSPGRHNPEGSCISLLADVGRLLTWMRENPYDFEAQGKVVALFETLPDDVRAALGHQAAVLTELAKAENN